MRLREVRRTSVSWRTSANDAYTSGDSSSPKALAPAQDDDLPSLQPSSRHTVSLNASRPVFLKLVVFESRPAHPSGILSSSSETARVPHSTKSLQTIGVTCCPTTQSPPAKILYDLFSTAS
ncbi:hypothetical protein R3P38DRAFT_3223779 [Favolaschia claudopus]|uniref:Uncharacterized protein n=1 Tax=Favolaschia claudopus TaxID=2862362 RepID=A0AAV9ZWR6_9AGAR